MMLALGVPGPEFDRVLLLSVGAYVVSIGTLIGILRQRRRSLALWLSSCSSLMLGTTLAWMCVRAGLEWDVWSLLGLIPFALACAGIVRLFLIKRENTAV